MSPVQVCFRPGAPSPVPSQPWVIHVAVILMPDDTSLVSFIWLEIILLLQHRWWFLFYDLSHFVVSQCHVMGLYAQVFSAFPWGEYSHLSAGLLVSN